MLNDDDGVALIDQVMQHFEELAHVFEMQSGGGLIQYIEGAPGGALGEFFRQLDPLRFAAGQGGGLLAEADVIQPDLLQQHHFVADGGHGLEEGHGFFDGHVQYVGDGLAFEFDDEGFAVVALAVTDIAGDIDIGQEVHFDFDQAIALARLTPAALDVEGKTPRLVAAGLGLGQFGKPIADRRERLGVSGGVGARRAANGALIDVDDFVDVAEAVDLFVGAGQIARAMQGFGQRFIESLQHQGRLAAAGHAGDTGEGAEREGGIDLLQVVGFRADDFNRLAVAFAALARHVDFFDAGEVGGGEGVLVQHHLGRGALGDHMPALNARAGAHINQVISGADGVFIMLDHNDGVADIAQATQRLQQALVVALVQADGRFIEHIQDAGEARADLRGEADALAFAARQGARVARQGEVFQADIVEEAEALVDFAQDAAGDFGVFGGEFFLQRLEPGVGLRDRQVRDFADVLAIDFDRQSFGLEAVAVAGFAFLAGLIFGEFFADPGGIGLAPAPRKIVDDAFKGFARFVFAIAIVELNQDGFITTAEKDSLLYFLGQLGPGGVHVGVVNLSNATQRLKIIRRRRGGVGPGGDRALGQGFALIGDDQIGVEGHADAETIAGGAGAEGVVEGEQPGFDFINGEAGDGAGELGGKHGAAVGVAAVRIRVLGEGDAIGEGQRGFQALGEAAFQPCADDDTIDHHFNIVLELFVERRDIVDFMEGAIDFNALKALLLQVGQLFAVFALAAADNGGQQVQPGAIAHGHDPVDHLGHGLGLDGQTGGGGIGHANTRPEQAHIVVNFRNRANGGAGVAAGGLLLDGDGGRQALYRVHIRLLHQLQELAGIGREALDITTLALCVDGIERQRAFARARKPSDYNELVAGQLNRDVLQVVLARATDADDGA